MFYGKMVNGSLYYRALENVSIAWALSTALTIYPCQIRVHQRWQSKLQLPTARKKEWRPATAGSSSQAVTCQHCDTHLPIVGPTRRATSKLSATDSPLFIKNIYFRLSARASFKIVKNSHASIPYYVVPYGHDTRCRNRRHKSTPFSGAGNRRKYLLLAKYLLGKYFVHQLTKYIVDSLAISESHTATNRHIASINYV